MSIKPKIFKVKRISVKVTPKASRTKVEKDLLPDEHGNEHYRVWVTVPPEDGKANKSVIEALSKFLGVPKSRINMVMGATGRNKIFELDV